MLHHRNVPTSVASILEWACCTSVTELPALSELAMPERKMLRNHSREYWYMGSTLARSDTQKKRIWVRTATGMYSMRVRSMSFSVCSAILTLAWVEGKEERC